MNQNEWNKKKKKKIQYQSGKQRINNHVLHMMPPTNAHTKNPVRDAMKNGMLSECEEEADKAEEGGCGIEPKTLG